MNTTWRQLSRTSMINFDLFYALFVHDETNIALLNLTRFLNNYYLITFLIIGTIGNCITLRILRKILAAQENFFRAFHVINETIALHFSFMLNIFTNYLITDSVSSKLACKLLTFGVHVSTDASAWCMVTVAFTVYLKLRSFTIFPPLKSKIFVLIIIYSSIILINLPDLFLVDTIQVRLSNKNFTSSFFTCGMNDKSILFGANMLDFFKDFTLPMSIRLIIYWFIRMEEKKVVKHSKRPSMHLFLSIFMLPVLVIACKVPIFIATFYNNLAVLNDDHEVDSLLHHFLFMLALIVYHFTHIVIVLMLLHSRFRGNLVKMVVPGVNHSGKKISVICQVDN